jgi:Cu/Ag efflux pump CusA
MRKLLNQLYKNHIAESMDTTCEEAAKMCFIDIAVNLHELVRLGFNPSEIENILDNQLTEGLDSSVISIIVSR